MLQLFDSLYLRSGNAHESQPTAYFRCCGQVNEGNSAIVSVTWPCLPCFYVVLKGQTYLERHGACGEPPVNASRQTNIMALFQHFLLRNNGTWALMIPSWTLLFQVGKRPWCVRLRAQYRGHMLYVGSSRTELPWPPVRFQHGQPTQGLRGAPRTRRPCPKPPATPRSYTTFPRANPTLLQHQQQHQQLPSSLTECARTTARLIAKQQRWLCSTGGLLLSPIKHLQSWRWGERLGQWMEQCTHTHTRPHPSSPAFRHG
jgi:hypothetical protein